MACKIKYKGETYSIKQFRNLVEGNPEEFQQYIPKLDMLAEGEIANFSNYLSAKFGVSVSTINDPDLPWASKIENGGVVVNTAKANYSDAWHEFSHPLLISMRLSNKDLFNNLYESLQETEEWNTIKEAAMFKVAKLYPEYEFKSEDFKEEVLATALGYGLGNKTKATGKFMAIINQIIDWITKALNLDTATSIYIRELNPNMSFSDLLTLMNEDEYKLRPDPDWATRDVYEIGAPGSLINDIYHFNREVDKEMTPFLAKRLKISLRPYNLRIVSKEEESFNSVRSKTKEKSSIQESIDKAIAGLISSSTPGYAMQEISHIANALDNPSKGSDVAVANDQGAPIDISTDFIRKLESDLTGKTQLDKPFSSSTAAEKEKSILQEFYNYYLEEIKKFFGNKPIPKSIDNKRLLNKYKTWLSQNYPVSYYLAQSAKFTYGLSEVIPEDRKDDLKTGHEVIISNKYLFKMGHTYTLVDDEGNHIIGDSYNGTGWYIYHNLYGDVPLIYEYQSDIIDELESLSSRLGVEGRNPEDVVQGYINYISGTINKFKKRVKELKEGALEETVLQGGVERTMFNAQFRHKKVLEHNDLATKIDKRIAVEYDTREKLMDSALDYLSISNYIKRINPKQRVGYLEKLLRENPEDFYSVLHAEEFKIMQKGIAIHPIKGFSSSDLKDLDSKTLIDFLKRIGSNDKPKIKAEKAAMFSELALKFIQSAKKAEADAYLLEHVKAVGPEKYEKLLGRHLELVAERAQAGMLVHAKNQLNDELVGKELVSDKMLDDAGNMLFAKLERLEESLKNTTVSSNADDVLKQIDSIKSIQLRFFIEHSFQYAKARGKNKVYLPTAQFIDEVESGDPWTLYVTPEDQKADSKYKASHIGSFYEALQEVPGISIEYKKVDGLKEPILEVNISNFNKGVERFSKTFDSPAMTVQSAEKRIEDSYKTLEAFRLPDGTIVLDKRDFEAKAPKIAEKIKKEFGWETLRGVVSFPKRTSADGKPYITLHIDRNELKKKLEPEQGDLFNTPVQDISDALKRASATNDKLQSRLDRIKQETNNIYKILPKIDNKNVQTSVREAVNNLRDPKKAADVSNFAYMIIEAKETLQYYAERLQELKKLNTKEQVAEIERVKTIADAFKDFVNYLERDFRYVPKENEFKQIISDMGKAYQDIQTIFSAESFELALDVMTEELGDDAKESLRILSKEKDNLQEQKAKAQAIDATKLVKRIDEKIADIDRKIRDFVPDRENLENTFRGLSPDLGWIPGNLRSALAMGDPIVSGFARRLKRGYDKVRRTLMPLRDEAYGQLVDYQRELGVGPNQSMAKFYEGLYEVQEFHEEGLDGDVKKNSYYTLLSPFKESFYNEMLNHHRKIKKLKGDGADPADVKAAEKEYRAFLEKYAERKYKDAWYDRYDLLTPEAEQAREEIITEIRNILKGNNAITTQEAERIFELKAKLKRLGSTFDETGKPKTGEALAIAKSLQAFSKASGEMSEWIITDENRAWFNAINDKKLEQVKLGQISQESYDNWFRLNTQRLISPEFYKERKKILDKISSIMSKLPKEQFREDMSTLWDTIFNVARSYRDEDNIIDGSDVKEEERKVIYDSENAIEELKRKLIRFSGLTIDEEQELAALWYSVESLTTKEAKRFTELKDRKAAHKAFVATYLTDTELKSLMNSFAELSQIQSRVPTEYYKIQYNKEVHKFREKIDPNFAAPIEDVQEVFERDSQWFKDNHILVTRKTVEDGHTYYIDRWEPLYHWNEVLPTNEKYIEQDAPGFAYRTREVKPEFHNVNYQEDVKGRIQPKKYINENGEVKLNPYVNEKYENLKNATDAKSQAKFRMLNFLTTVHLQEQKELPIFKRLGYILPGLMKDRYDRTVEGGIQGIKQGIKNQFIKTQEDKDLTLGDVSQMDLSIIPLKYSTPVKPEDQNLNLLEAVLQHRAAIEEYKFLDSEVGTAKVVQEALNSGKETVSQSMIDKVLERTGFSRFIKPDKASRRSRVFNEFLRTYFYGEHEVNFPDLIPGVSTNKILGNLLGLSSVQLMILNIPAHITNVVSGEIQNMIESSAGKYFTWGDYLKSKVTYSANVGNFWKDYAKEGGKSKWTAIIEYFDVPQGEFLDNFGRKTNFSRLRDFKNHLMLIKQTGEHEIQVTTLMAMMENYKVDYNGSTVPLYDALEYRDGKIRIKNGAKIGDRELSTKDLDSFEDRVHAVLRQLNGAYSRIDRTLAEKTLLGKLAFYMRKYFMPMYFRRFETFKYDYEEQEFKEGYYITTAKLMKDLVKLNAELVRNWSVYKDSLSQEEKANVKRFMSEISIITILALAIFLVGGYDDDRELKGRWLYTMALYQLMKAKSEAETQLPLPGFGINELTSIFSSPFAAASTAKTAGRALTDFSNWLVRSDDAEFKRDYGVWDEGDLRWHADLLKLWGINTNVLTPENIVKNFELRNR